MNTLRFLFMLLFFICCAEIMYSMVQKNIEAFAASMYLAMTCAVALLFLNLNKNKYGLD